MAKLGHYPPPPLSRWSLAWRYALALAPVLLVLLMWLSSTVPEQVPPNSPMFMSTRDFVLDLIITAVCLVLYRFRRRWPLIIGVLVNLAWLGSFGAMGVTSLVTVSVATRRRWSEILVLGAVNLVVTLMVLVRDGPINVLSLILQLVLQALTFAVVVFVGMYIGARRDLLASLQERAETAEREQLLRVQQARVGERSRIAREMHDVMAHRVSLVAMHADALVFREDLSADQMRDAAKIIQQNAHQALTELRGVLGALRQGDDAVAPPQPTLAALDALLEDAREGGQRIDARIDLDVSSVPERISRDAFRVLQEALTNARKHAPGAKVTVLVSRDKGVDGPGLRILVTNPLALGGSTVPGSQVGLVGVRERVEMADGRITVGRTDDAFTLDAWLPMSERTTGALQ